MSRVKGINGVFIKSEDPDKLRSWYLKHLGINGMFHWIDVEDKAAHHTTWNVLPSSSEIFSRTEKSYVISYCVDDLHSMLKELKAQGAKTLGEVTNDDNGEFVSLLDPEGNKIILRQANTTGSSKIQSNPEKVTGLGGVFFRAKDVATINAWYNKHLGLATTEWGYVFKWMDPNDKDAAVPAGTVWCPFKSDTEYFGPNNKQCMLDYRVKNLPELMKTLTDAGVETVGKIDEYSYGKFGWIMDPEGNKIELWEAKDDGF